MEEYRTRTPQPDQVSQSLQSPPMKRGSPWLQGQSPAEPLSFSAPVCKRRLIEITTQMPEARAGCLPPPSFCSSQMPEARAGCLPPPSFCSSIFDLPTGCLEERFELTGTVLGSGQFGVVRECRDVFTGELLACKSVRKKKQSWTQGEQGEDQGHGQTGQGEVGPATPAPGQELRNEVQLMLRLLGHGGVVQLRGVFEDSQSVHLVMDMCEGGDLFEEVVRQRRLQEADSAHVFAEIVRAVAFCHSRGVLHRDLKPENVLLTRRLQDGETLAEAAKSGPVVKLADFGLAVPMEPGQVHRGRAGSPYYMAPEVVSGDYSFKADVWSLGVVLYTLLSGSPPFFGQTDSDVYEAISRGKPNLTTGPWAQVSPEARNLVKCLLLSDASRRPSAQKILTHPWIVRHLAPHRLVRRVITPGSAKAVPLPVT